MKNKLMVVLAVACWLAFNGGLAYEALTREPVGVVVSKFIAINGMVGLVALAAFSVARIIGK